MANNTSQVWLITGCSSGFGREIAAAALASGARVVLTARDPATLTALCADYPETSLALSLDVTQAHQIDAVVAQSIAHFSSIDVLVNNAGYGYVGAIEEGEDEAVRQLFETNFFSALALTRAVLPQMRKQGGGRILNNSSQAGLMANPGTGYYSASKYALEGLMEALGKEVQAFNIYVTCVQPGAFRTDWSGRSMQRAPSMEVYQAHVGSRLDMIAAIDGQQPGDPVRAAQVFLELAVCEDPPAQLLLGAGVLASYREKIADISTSLQRWESTSLSVDFPAE